MRQTVIYLAIGLLVSSALASAQVYRSVDEQGNVTYSAEPPADAREVEPVEIQPGPSEAQQREAERRTRELQNAGGGSGKDGAPGQSKKQGVQEAKAQLEAAERKLEQAKQVGPGDRQGTAGGGSRFTDSYRKRVSDAEAGVEAARQRLKEAQRAKP
jgi:hypothetical protein